MGNLCTKDEIVYLENKIDEQNTNIERLIQEMNFLRRENKYLNNRLNAIKT